MTESSIMSTVASRNFTESASSRRTARGLFKTRYIVCTADKIREVDEIKPKQILGLAPKKEYVNKFNNQPKPTINNEF